MHHTDNNQNVRLSDSLPPPPPLLRHGVPTRDLNDDGLPVFRPSLSSLKPAATPPNLQSCIYSEGLGMMSQHESLTQMKKYRKLYLASNQQQVRSSHGLVDMDGQSPQQGSNSDPIHQDQQRIRGPSAVNTAAASMSGRWMDQMPITGYQVQSNLASKNEDRVRKPSGESFSPYAHQVAAMGLNSSMASVSLPTKPLYETVTQYQHQQQGNQVPFTTINTSCSVSSTPSLHAGNISQGQHSHESFYSKEQEAPHVQKQQTVLTNELLEDVLRMRNEILAERKAIGQMSNQSHQQTSSTYQKLAHLLSELPVESRRQLQSFIQSNSLTNKSLQHPANQNISSQQVNQNMGIQPQSQNISTQLQNQNIGFHQQSLGTGFQQPSQKQNSYPGVFDNNHTQSSTKNYPQVATQVPTNSSDFYSNTCIVQNANNASYSAHRTTSHQTTMTVQQSVPPTYQESLYRKQQFQPHQSTLPTNPNFAGNIHESFSRPNQNTRASEIKPNYSSSLLQGITTGQSSSSTPMSFINTGSDQHTVNPGDYLKSHDIPINTPEVSAHGSMYHSHDLLKQPVRCTVQQSVRHPIQQSVRPPIQQSVRPPIQQSVRHPIQQSVRHPIQQSVRHPIQQSVRHPIQQLVGHTIQQSVGHPIQSVGPPIQQSVGHTIQQSVGHTIQQSVGHPIQQLVGHPIQQSVRHPIQQSVGHPIQQLVGHPVQQSVGHLIQQSVGHPVQQSVRHSIQHSVGHSMQQSVGHPVQQSVPHTRPMGSMDHTDVRNAEISSSLHGRHNIENILSSSSNHSPNSAMGKADFQKALHKLQQTIKVPKSKPADDVSVLNRWYANPEPEVQTGHLNKQLISDVLNRWYMNPEAGVKTSPLNKHQVLDFPPDDLSRSDQQKLLGSPLWDDQNDRQNVDLFTLCGGQIFTNSEARETKHVVDHAHDSVSSVPSENNSHAVDLSVSTTNKTTTLGNNATTLPSADEDVDIKPDIEKLNHAIDMNPVGYRVNPESANKLSVSQEASDSRMAETGAEGTSEESSRGSNSYVARQVDMSQLRLNRSEVNSSSSERVSSPSSVISEVNTSGKNEAAGTVSLMCTDQSIQGCVSSADSLYKSVNKQSGKLLEEAAIGSVELTSVGAQHVSGHEHTQTDTNVSNVELEHAKLRQRHISGQKRSQTKSDGSDEDYHPPAKRGKAAGRSRARGGHTKRGTARGRARSKHGFRSNLGVGLFSPVRSLKGKVQGQRGRSRGRASHRGRPGSMNKAATDRRSSSVVVENLEEMALDDPDQLFNFLSNASPTELEQSQVSLKLVHTILRMYKADQSGDRSQGSDTATDADDVEIDIDEVPESDIFNGEENGQLATKDDQIKVGDGRVVHHFNKQLLLKDSEKEDEDIIMDTLEGQSSVVGLSVQAEGVETENQADIQVKQLDVDVSNEMEPEFFDRNGEVDRQSLLKDVQTAAEGKAVTLAGKISGHNAVSASTCELRQRDKERASVTNEISDKSNSLDQKYEEDWMGCIEDANMTMIKEKERLKLFEEKTSVETNSEAKDCSNFKDTDKRKKSDTNIAANGSKDVNLCEKEDGSTNYDVVRKGENASSLVLVHTYRLSDTHSMTWVRFHGKVVTSLILPEGKFVILKEIIKRCFRISDENQQEKMKKRQTILRLKKSVLKIPDRWLDSTFYPYVDKSLRKRGVMKAVPSKMSIVSETEANELFHYVLKDQYCANGCVAPHYSSASANKKKANIEDKNIPEQPLARNRSVSGTSSEGGITVFDFDESNLLLRKSCSTLGYNQFGDELDGFSSDSTLPYVDGKPRDLLEVIDSGLNSSKNNYQGKIDDGHKTYHRDGKSEAENDLDNDVIFVGEVGKKYNIVKDIASDDVIVIDDSQDENLEEETQDMKEDPRFKHTKAEEKITGIEPVSSDVHLLSKETIDTGPGLQHANFDNNPVEQSKDVLKDNGEDISDNIEQRMEESGMESDENNVIGEKAVLFTGDAESWKDRCNVEVRVNEEDQMEEDAEKRGEHGEEKDEEDKEDEGRLENYEVSMLLPSTDLSKRGRMFLEAEKSLNKLIKQANKAKHSDLGEMYEKLVEMVPWNDWTMDMLDRYEATLTIPSPEDSCLEELTSLPFDSQLID